MSEWKVQVVKVGKLEKHPNADRLLLGRVFDYPVITAVGEFQENDLAVYLPVDSVVPSDDPRWAFLKGRHRVRAARLRGIFSMGLLTKAEPGMVEGEIVAERLRITKYAPPEPMSMGGDNEKCLFDFPVYTDIEGLRRWPDVLKDGEEVQVTEKVHGCVQSRTKISMEDSTRKAISKVEVGNVVLGVDKIGRLVPSKVLRKYDNGKAEKWLKVTGQRRRAGRGSHFFAITCTPEHKFWNPRLKQYTLAANLKERDTVLLLRSELGLTPVQEQVLLGKMLGDGSLADNGVSAHIAWSHRSEDKEYLEWTCRAVGDLDSGSRQLLQSGYGSEMVRARTTNNVWIKDKFGTFFSASFEKRVPEWVAEELTPLAVAFWYMDDGSIGEANDGSEPKAHFAVCAFTREDCDILVRGLKRLGIDSVYYESDGYARLRLNADDAERLFLLIAPYVPSSMQRKLPDRYRGHAGWLPSIKQSYKPALVEQEIISVAETKEFLTDVRHDIETETGNYFANGVLVHNSNARYVWHLDRLWSGSHTGVKKPDPANLWWKAAYEAGLEAILKKAPGIAFYGEVYGQVQDLKYGHTRGGSASLLFFDALELATRRYLDVDEFERLAAELGLKVVPRLYRGPWRLDLAGLAEGKTLVSNDHVREGFVVRPVKERWDDRVGRCILKRHGEGYLTR